jgi:pimeloyl-ACP methyl ester carboxylesterase
MKHLAYLGCTPDGYHKLHATRFGLFTHKPPVICVHGLARNCRDFDFLAEALASFRYKRTVFCPDMAGRGQSDWLKNPLLYNFPQYISDINVLFAKSGAKTFDWVGTSMGGVLGMLIAALPNNPIRKLILNDVGPFLSASSTMRIAAYMGQTPATFADKREMELYLRTIYAGFGQLADVQWKHMADTSARKLENGRLALDYDPAIGVVMQTLGMDIFLWDFYNRIKCPVLVIRGANSDILSESVAKDMTERGPKASSSPLKTRLMPPRLCATNKSVSLPIFSRPSLEEKCRKKWIASLKLWFGFAIRKTDARGTSSRISRQSRLARSKKPMRSSRPSKTKITNISAKNSAIFCFKSFFTLKWRQKKACLPSRTWRLPKRPR